MVQQGGIMALRKMALHKMAFHQEGGYDEHYLQVPPKSLLKIVPPKENWYVEGVDSKAHRRILHLDRGFYMFFDWWKGRDVDFSCPITENAFYALYGSEELEELVRNMHARLAPHQKIQDKTLVFGVGGMQLLCASLYAVAVYHSLEKTAFPHEEFVPISHVYVTQPVPAYLELKKCLQGYLGSLASWVDFSEHRSVAPDQLVEYVTTPNNPDGLVRKPATHARFHIHDRVNHMPFLFHEDPADYMEETLEGDWLSIFSLSKFFGFSGSRVGYAFVQDPDIARFMKYYVFMDTHGDSLDGQLRCIAALKYLQKKNLLQDYVGWTSAHLKDRWSKLREALAGKKIEILNQQGPNMWMRVPVKDAEKYLMQKYHIHATYGPEYGVGQEYVRFNMLETENEFQELLHRLSDS